ncbi:MAG: tetratricopeptide repeat protein [Symploca sp. SIO1C4]|uniref:Tetratricopeptide repeat protein n=1 Tax=Symploca sp. SIO1C4 TaxID=2607765 RepID=A0A6B3NI77_9CYAN|nr:tetratricopeptide repeat protein [Symploca sp. SIO1C4]
MPNKEQEYDVCCQHQFPLAPPTWGFVGRQLEIAEIEKALEQHNILLLRGMAGVGKTTLLNYLCQRWQMTNFAQDIFYFSYEQQAWTLAQILFEIGKKVYENSELAQFQELSQQGQIQKLVSKLRSQDYILIIDNLESLTGQRLAIKNILPKEQRDQIQNLLSQLLGGKTRAVLSSRSGEYWLQPETFQTNIYPLQGLDQEARLLLAQRILQSAVSASHLAEIIQDQYFEKLMQLLAGYPLAMEVILANLKQQSPQEIWQRLQGKDVNSEDQAERLVKCVEYIYRNPSREAQNLLLCLAPFSEFIERSFSLPNYFQQLQTLKPWSNYTFDNFNNLIQEAIKGGFLLPTKLSSELLNNNKIISEHYILKITPCFSYLLKAKLDHNQETTNKALLAVFVKHYQLLADSYQSLMQSQDIEQQKLGVLFCQLEYNNLHQALLFCLKQQASINIFFCLDKYYQLLDDLNRRLKLSEFVCQAQQTYLPQIQTGKRAFHRAMALDRLAISYLQMQQYQKAKESYQQVLKLLQSISGVEQRQKQLALGSTYYQLGMVSRELGELEVAQQHYQQALVIFSNLSARNEQGKAYQQLKVVAQKMQEIEKRREQGLGNR